MQRYRDQKITVCSKSSNCLTGKASFANEQCISNSDDLQRKGLPKDLSNIQDVLQWDRYCLFNVKC